MRATLAGMGEIAGAIIVLGIAAAVAPIMVYSYQDRMDDSSGVIRKHIEMQLERAEELLAFGSALCRNGTLHVILHNYSDKEAEASEMSWYEVRNDSIAEILPVEYRSLAGDNTSAVPAGSATIATLHSGCEYDEMILVTPARSRMTVP